MPRARVHSQTVCNDCDRPFYAKGLCKSCYMKANRMSFRKPGQKKINIDKLIIEDPEDFWQFVKKELNIG